jgi:hypothetical protein
MRKIRIYYKIKPFLSWGLRMTARRLAAVPTRRLSRKTWPIHPDSAKPPVGWPGWPEGKKFAFVITHDVERREGLANSPELMRLDQTAGFRSSFNFVPEGDYQVSKELREQLAQSGFEVGIHDLHHDGKLYESRDVFAAKAGRINKYVKQWGAKGFRSAFMHHNLEWLHDLDVQYDASTFDCDPFEPQPDGACTIFPFWVSRASTKTPGPPDTRNLRPTGQNGRRDGYYELPYTLAQDSTIFFVLGERTIDVWRKKLDWIAEQGGMALINVHPDYMAFGGRKPTRKEYSAARYREFLEYVSTRYRGLYWNPLPRELCDYLSHD